MAMRGIRKPGAVTTTSAVRGHLPVADRTRAEAMSLIRVGDRVMARAGAAAVAAGFPARPVRGDGRPERHARLLLRRRPLSRAATAPSRTARRCAADGVDIVDVGGESTRPGAGAGAGRGRGRPGRAGDSRTRRSRRPCSVDTTRAAVAEAALEAGASDRQRRLRRAGRSGDGARWSRTRGVPWILMHWRGHSADMDALARYDDVVAEVRAELLDRVDAAVRPGSTESRWCSTRARVRQDRRPQLGAAAAASDELICAAGASRC